MAWVPAHVRLPVGVSAPVRGCRLGGDPFRRPGGVPGQHSATPPPGVRKWGF